MEILRLNKGEGKTTELIKLSNESWTYILCRDTQRVDNIVKRAGELNIDIPYPITIRELPLSSGSRINSLLIDDVEDVLEALLRKKVDMVTTSSEVIDINF